MRHSPCHKSLVFVLLKLREAYLSIVQVKESKKVNEVSDLYSLCSRHWKVLMGAIWKEQGVQGRHTRAEGVPSPVACLHCACFYHAPCSFSHIIFKRLLSRQGSIV